MPLPTPADDSDRKLLADVQEFGWHIIGVEEDDVGPAFAYSIGLYHTFQHPEIILFGLDVPTMQQIINGIGQQVKEGKRFEHLNEEGDVLEGFNVFFRHVEQQHFSEYLGCGCWFYQSKEFPALQCVWPDSQHRYPWHPDINSTLAQRQPILSQDDWPFHEGKNRAAFTTQQVLEGYPVLLVSHDEDGDWQFLCGTTNSSKDGRIVGLGTILKRDPTLAEVADLPDGWTASRDLLGGTWQRSKTDDA